MVVLNFKTREKMELIHLALSGSPGYIANELAIVEDKEMSPDGFQLVIGNENLYDLVIDMD